MIDNKMSKFYSVFSSVVFRRVLVIFVVGFFVRGVVSFVFEVDVFKEFINSISLVYYGFMLGILGIFSELPSISLEVFSISSIRKAISTILVSSGDTGKIILGGEVSSVDGVDKSGGNEIGVNKKGVNNTGVMFVKGVNTVESVEGSGSSKKRIGSGSSKRIGSGSSKRIGSSSGVSTSDSNGVISDNMLTRAPLISGLSTPDDMSSLVGGFSRSGSEVSSVDRLTKAPVISKLLTPENMSPLVGGFSSNGSDISSVDRLTRAPVIGSLSTPDNMSPLVGGFSSSGISSSGIGSNRLGGDNYIVSRVPSYQSMTNTHYSSARVSSNQSIKSSLRREGILDETMVRDVSNTRKVEVNSWNTAEFEARRKSEFGKRKDLILAAIENSNVEENTLSGEGVGVTKEKHTKSSVLGKVMTKFNEYIDSPSQDENHKSVSITSRSVNSTSRSVRYSKSAGVRGLYGMGKR